MKEKNSLQILCKTTIYKVAIQVEMHYNLPLLSARFIPVVRWTIIYYKEPYFCKV